MIRRRYADGRYGQVHLRENSRVEGVPLVCLHATAYSSRSFCAILEALDGKRHVIALDTPGYGESDGPSRPISMADYAVAIADALPDRCDVFGYHTGVSIAVELALANPVAIGRLTFMGIPYFQALDFVAWRAKLVAKHRLDETLSQFEERWRFLVTERPGGLPLWRGFENFVDELKTWPTGWHAHEALFEHDLTARLGELTQPVTVLNPAGHLAGASRLAADKIPDATLIDLPDVTGAVLDLHADLLAHYFLEPAAVLA